MKIYWRDINDGYKLYTGEVDYGAECIEIGARPHDRDEEPIDRVDYLAKTFSRRGSSEVHPFPAKWYRTMTLQNRVQAMLTPASDEAA